MKKSLLFFFLATSGSYLFAQKPQMEPMVLITTELGNIKVRLYNETPAHRDNFLELVQNGFYNGTLFHRIITNFMIQGGDPDSKKAKSGEPLGEGGPGYLIPAEINKKCFHKKGALAAARMGDDVNPKKESSGSQFYIVHGKTFIESDLRTLETRKNSTLKDELRREYFAKKENAPYREKLQKLQQEKDNNGIMSLLTEIDPKLEKDFAVRKHSFSAEQVKAYSTTGGSPHLDGDYTVFGEVVEGLDVIDKIAALERDKMDRPVKDVKMTMKVVK